MFAISEFKALLDRLNEGIVRGEHKSVRDRLLGINLSNVAREHYLPLAQLAYRSGTPSITLRLLGSLLKDGRKARDPISGEELAEYAMALIQMGASREALRWLRSINNEQTPRALLYEAFASITEWDYESAAPALQKYLKTLSLSDYQVTVAETNLAACFLQTHNFHAAESLLKELLDRTRSMGFTLLRGNCLEMSAQLAIHTGKFDLAEAHLSEAESALTASGAIDHLFVRKWKILMELRKRGPQQELLLQWSKLRTEALALGHWETVREHDYYLSLFTLDEQLLFKVYFGTPFDSYRKTILKSYPHDIIMPNFFSWSPIGNSRNRVFDMERATEVPAGADLKEGQSLHRLFKILASDFYRAFSIGSIFTSMYPSEGFNVSSSPQRVHQLIFRLRDWLKKSEIPIEVYETRFGGYRIRFLEPYAIRVSSARESLTSSELEVVRLANAFYRREFTTQDAAKFLGMSKRHINNLIAKDEGRTFEKLGSGPLTRYKTRAA